MQKVGAKMKKKFLEKLNNPAMGILMVIPLMFADEFIHNKTAEFIVDVLVIVVWFTGMILIGKHFYKKNSK